MHFKLARSQVTVRTVGMYRTLFVMTVFLGSMAFGSYAQDTVSRPVKLAKIESSDRVLTRQFFGSVTARQTVDLAFQVSGQIQDFPVLEGAVVAKGDLIAELDLEPFQRALDQARVQKDQADRALDRFNQLSSSAVSQVSIDDAQSAADLAALSVSDAEYALEQATLSAPFDGLAASRNYANFSTVSAGTPVVRLHDVSEWRVEIDVPEVLFRSAGEDPDLNLVGRFTGTDRTIPLVIREFTADDEADSARQLLSALPAVQDVIVNSAQGNSLNLVVDKGGDALGAVQGALKQAGLPTFGISQSQPSLDDVYLAATGRSLMDAEMAAAGTRDLKKERKQSMR